MHSSTFVIQSLTAESRCPLTWRRPRGAWPRITRKQRTHVLTVQSLLLSVRQMDGNTRRSSVQWTRCLVWPWQIYQQHYNRQAGYPAHLTFIMTPCSFNPYGKRYSLSWSGNEILINIEKIGSHITWFVVVYKDALSRWISDYSVNTRLHEACMFFFCIGPLRVLVQSCVYYSE